MKNWARAIRAGLAEARRFGVTGIDEISSTEDVRAYQTLLGLGELTLRISTASPRCWNGRRQR